MPVDMNKKFDVLTLSRNDLLKRFDEVDPLSDKVKTMLETLTDTKMEELIELYRCMQTLTLNDNITEVMEELVERSENGTLGNETEDHYYK